jgi:hypothetical protein
MSAREGLELAGSLAVLAAVVFPIFRFIARGGRP